MFRYSHDSLKWSHSVKMFRFVTTLEKEKNKAASAKFNEITSVILFPSKTFFKHHFWELLYIQNCITGTGKLGTPCRLGMGSNQDFVNASRIELPKCECESNRVGHC